MESLFFVADGALKVLQSFAAQLVSNFNIFALKFNISANLFFLVISAQ